MQVTTRAFTVPKGGNAFGENEDVARPRSSLVNVPLTSEVAFRAAVADGATESAFAGLWATLLADAWQDGVIAPDDPAPGIAECAASWRAFVARDFEALPWFAQDKARAGSWAALLGVTVAVQAEGGTASWHALSLGDCGLFHVCGDALVTAFPYTRSDDYHSRPLLVGTEETERASMGKFARTERGEAQVGDMLYLATDALAAWFLREHEADRAPWRWLRGLRNEAGGENGGISFPAFVQERRAMGRLQNDDTTLVILDLNANNKERRDA